MKKLLVRMLREIKSNFGQFLSIVMIIAIGSMLFSGMFAAIRAMDDSVETYYEDQHMADLWLTFQNAGPDDVEKLLMQRDVETAEGRYTVSEAITLDGQDVTLRFHSMTQINSSLLTEGTIPDDTDEVMVDYKFAELNNLEPGSSFVIKDHTMTVTGLCMNPEYAYKQKDSGSSSSVNKTFGIVYATKDTVKELVLEKSMTSMYASDLGYQEILVRTANPESILLFAEHMDGYIAGTTRAEQASFTTVGEALAPIRSIAYVFPFIFFFVAALVAFISLSKMVENQRMQIAVMQAIGISKRTIRYSFFFYSILAALSGGILFSLLGNLLVPKLLIQVFVNRFELPEIPIPIYALYCVVPVVLAVVFCQTAAWIALQRVLSEIPAQAMRPKPPAKSKKIILEKVGFLWTHLNYSGKLIARNIFLNKRRILLSAVGTIGSVMLIFTGVSLRNSALMVLQQNADTMQYDFNITYNEAIENKESVSFAFPVQEKELTKSGKGTLNGQEMGYQLLEEKSSLVSVFDEDGQLLPIQKNSVILPGSYAKENKVEVGDSIVLMVEDISYELLVTDISNQYSGSTLYLCFEEAKDVGMNVSTSTILVQAQDSADLDKALDTLSEADTIKNVTTKSDVVSRSKEMLKTLNATILLILVSASILSITVVYNTTSISIFERTREYATLMVLGFHKHEVNHLTMVENLVLAVFSCICGLPLGFGLFEYIAGMVSRDNLRLPLVFDLKMAAVTVCLTLLFVILTNLLLRKKVKDIVLTEALKSIE